MKVFLAALMSLILVGAALFGVLWFEYQGFLATPIERVSAPQAAAQAEAQNETQREVQGEAQREVQGEAQHEPRVFEIRPGTRLRQLATRLTDEGL
ncbi:MAG: hypothetical protein ACLFTD_05615, partial [Halochromatium sp.]